MTEALIVTARANRIAALAHLETKRRRASQTDGVVDLSSHREKRVPTPVFTSCRATEATLKLAA